MRKIWKEDLLSYQELYPLFYTLLCNHIICDIFVHLMYDIMKFTSKHVKSISMAIVPNPFWISFESFLEMNEVKNSLQYD